MGAADFLRSFERTRTHFTARVKRDYEVHFDNVGLIPLHQVTPTRTLENGKQVNGLLEYIFCQPDYLRVPTPHICRAVRNGDFDNGPIRLNPSANLDYDVLALAVHERSLVPSNSIRPWLRKRVTAYHQRKLKNREYPRVCMPQDKILRLEQLSLEMEEQLLSPISANRRKEHQVACRNLVDEHAYCLVDVNATLQLREWKSFIRKVNLKPPEWNSFLRKPVKKKQKTPS